jgi:hypothetical protein
MMYDVCMYAPGLGWWEREQARRTEVTPQHLSPPKLLHASHRGLGEGKPHISPTHMRLKYPPSQSPACRFDRPPQRKGHIAVARPPKLLLYFVDGLRTSTGTRDQGPGTRIPSNKQQRHDGKKQQVASHLERRDNPELMCCRSQDLVPSIGPPLKLESKLEPEPELEPPHFVFRLIGNVHHSSRTRALQHTDYCSDDIHPEPCSHGFRGREQLQSTVFALPRQGPHGTRFALSFHRRHDHRPPSRVFVPLERWLCLSRALQFE